MATHPTSAHADAHIWNRSDFDRNHYTCPRCELSLVHVFGRRGNTGGGDYKRYFMQTREVKKDGRVRELLIVRASAGRLPPCQRGYLLEEYAPAPLVAALERHQTHAASEVCPLCTPRQEHFPWKRL